MSYPKPLHWWTDNVLPLVYDESLSYYEVMSKIITYINGITQDTVELENLVNELKELIETAGIDTIPQILERLDNLDSAVANLGTDNAQNKEDIADLETDNTQNKEDIADLKTDNTQNKEDIADLKADNAQNKEDIINLNSAVDRLENNVLTNAVKDAILQIARKVAYIDGGGQTYYADLFEALYHPVGITAVYTQTGTVTELSDINDLKTDLVVTAFNENQETFVIPDNAYTLSGTLIEGTTTITVTYNGLTADFSVVVSPFILTQQDISIGRSMQTSYPYSNTNPIRSIYQYFDIPVKAGVTYIATFDWNTDYDLYCSIITYTSDILDLVAAHSNITDVTDTTWTGLSAISGVLEFTPIYDTVMRINCKIGSAGSASFDSQNTYFNSIKIGRKTGA